MSDDSLLGTTLDGRYKVVRLIGVGGMGSVYEAQHVSTGRRVAIKVITGDVAKNEALVSRFHREAKAAGGIDSKHIAQVLDTGTDPSTGHPFMVMEYLAGEDAQQLFRRLGPLPPDLALRIAAQALIGLQKAHEARVVHRDIKPANLFLARRDEGEILVKLLDFGIAKVKMDQAISAETAGLTRTGSMLGSPLYMSPEQARGLKTIDGRADIWCLGIVLYQALTGRTPHQDVDALGELIIAICSELPRPVQDLAPWVPPNVAAVVHGALRFDPAERYQSAAEMLDRIQPLLPDGWHIEESMLVPLTAEERARVEPRYSVVPASGGVVIPGRIPTYRPDDPPPSVPDSLASAAATAATIAVTDPAATTGGVSGTKPGAPRSSLVLALAAGALVLVGGGAFGALKLMAPAVSAGALSGGPQPGEAQAGQTGPVASAPDPGSAAEPEERTVNLVVLPEDAVIEVDGAARTAKDGVVEIRGTLGSTHRVRVARNGIERVAEVTVTESGAKPPKVEIEALVDGHAAASATAGPSAAPSAAAPSTARPSSGSGAEPSRFVVSPRPSQPTASFMGSRSADKPAPPPASAPPPPKEQPPAPAIDKRFE